MMTTISAFMVKTTPILALKVRNMETSTPLAAISAPPMAKAMAAVARTSMATSCAEMGSTATARTAVPARVRVRPKYRASPITAAKASASSRLAATVTPKICTGTARKA